MKTLSYFFFVLVLGLGLGGGLTWISVQQNQGFGALIVGEWVAWPQAGSNEADPYTDARIAVDGQVPLGAAEGVLFVATKDKDGEPLKLECDYRLKGALPNARYWTIEAKPREEAFQDQAGFGNTAPLNSTDMVWHNGEVEIVVGKSLRGGHWVPVKGKGPMQLGIRLYDSQVTGTGVMVGLGLPQISLLRCV